MKKLTKTIIVIFICFILTFLLGYAAGKTENNQNFYKWKHTKAK